MEDIIGKALLDYYYNNHPEAIITETNISEEDELPVEYLFRNFEEMPLIEQKALQACKGKVLDVGCGAGSHALYLQQNGYDVTAIDVSVGAIQVAKARGILKAECESLLNISASQGAYDTILLLMNGTGIFETLEKLPSYLEHLKSLLLPDGKILVDSSDLKYMYDRQETNEGEGIWVPADRYYGELTFTMRYKGKQSMPFNWLYIDPKRFETLCLAQGLKFKMLYKGEHYDYLAALSI